MRMQTRLKHHFLMSPYAGIFSIRRFFFILDQPHTAVCFRSRSLFASPDAHNTKNRIVLLTYRTQEQLPSTLFKVKAPNCKHLIALRKLIKTRSRP